MSFIYLEKRKLNNKIVPFNANRFIVSKFSGLWRLVSWQNERFKREVYSNTMTLPPPHLLQQYFVFCFVGHFSKSCKLKLNPQLPARCWPVQYSVLAWP